MAWCLSILLFTLSFITSVEAQTAITESRCRAAGGQFYKVRREPCVCPHDGKSLDPSRPAAVAACRQLALASAVRTMGKVEQAVARPLASEVCDDRPVRHPLGCPQHLEANLVEDKNGLTIKTVKAPNKACSIPKKNHLRSATLLENHLANDPSTMVNMPAARISQICLLAGSDAQKSFVVAEYYYLMNRIKVAIAKHLDEMAAIDSIIGPEILHGINCQQVRDFPDVSAGCQDLKNQCRPEKKVAGSKIKTSLEEIAEKTEAARKSIDLYSDWDKTNMNRELRAKWEKEVEKASEHLPWMKGQKFRQTYDKKKKNAKQAVTEQFKANRVQLKRQLDALQKASTCLGDKKGSTNCRGFMDTIANYTEDLPLPPDSQLTPQMRDVVAEFRRVQCHMDQREEIAETKRNFNNFMKTGALTALSFLSGPVARGVLAGLGRGQSLLTGARAVARAGSTATNLVTGTALVVPPLGWTVVEAERAIKACSQMRDQVQITNHPHGISRPAVGICPQPLVSGTNAGWDINSCLLATGLTGLNMTYAGMGSWRIVQGVRGKDAAENPLSILFGEQRRIITSIWTQANYITDAMRETYVLGQNLTGFLRQNFMRGVTPAEKRALGMEVSIEDQHIHLWVRRLEYLDEKTYQQVLEKLQGLPLLKRQQVLKDLRKSIQKDPSPTRDLEIAELLIKSQPIR